jgi:hypothetical protein
MEGIRHLINNILKSAEPIKLAEMDSVALLNRVDRKYILHLSQLPAILERLIKDYYVLEIGPNRTFTYRTIYFDTPNYQFFKDHHNGLTNRIKVRCREYVETNNSFFEIKRKYQGTRTDKFRKPVQNINMAIGKDEFAEIHARYKKHQLCNLNVTLENLFYRLTLVSKNFTERVTIDFDVSFRNASREALLTDIAIVEVKQGKTSDMSPVVQLFKKQRIFPGSISKYSYGLLLISDNIKYNAFKPLMSKVAKIQNNGIIRNGTGR